MPRHPGQKCEKMCASRTPFEKLLHFGSDGGQIELDHDLLSKVVSLHDRIAFFQGLGGHPDLDDWTNLLFEQTCQLAPIFKKPVAARISLADGLAVPRARSILPIHPLASSPLPRPPLWMYDLPFGPETGVKAQPLDDAQRREVPLPGAALLDRSGPVSADDVLALADRDGIGVGHHVMLGRGAHPFVEPAEDATGWRFRGHSAQLRLFGPIDLTGAEVEARTCAYAGRAIQRVIDLVTEKKRPTAFAMSGTMCGEHVLGAAVAVPLAKPSATGVELVILVHDLHCASC